MNRIYRPVGTILLSMLLSTCNATSTASLCDEWTSSSRVYYYDSSCGGTSTMGQFSFVLDGTYGHSELTLFSDDSDLLEIRSSQEDYNTTECEGGVGYGSFETAALSFRYDWSRVANGAPTVEYQCENFSLAEAQVLSCAHNCSISQAPYCSDCTVAIYSD